MNTGIKVYHVVAMAKNRVIGKDNKLPWHFPEDLKHFKELTSGSTVIMGRKTYESIGRPLPNRDNFVLSRTQTGEKNGVTFFNSYEDALRAVKSEKAFVIGGGKIYEQTMDKVDGIYATFIDAEYEGDAFYPDIPATFQKKDECVIHKNPELKVLHYESK